MRSLPNSEIVLTEMPVSARISRPLVSATNPISSVVAAVPSSNSMPGVHVLDVLPDDDEVDGVVVRRHARVEPARPDAGEQLELAAERQVHAPHPARHRRLDRPLQGDARRPDRRERGRRERVADAREDARPHVLVVPCHGHAGRLDRTPGRLDHLGTDPVTRDQRDAIRHSIPPRRDRSRTAPLAESFPPSILTEATRGPRVPRRAAIVRRKLVT